MVDQAYNLRSLMRNKEELPPKPPNFNSRVITVTSGKGGVGKSNITLNLAIQFSKAGKRVIVIDADFGLANVEVLMGIMPKYSLLDVIKGTRSITEVMNDGPAGIRFISGGSGLTQMANMTEQQVAFLMESFSILDKTADIILIDTGAGMSHQVITLISASRETIIITTPEPTSITDSYAIIKTVSEREGGPSINVIINQVDSEKEGEVVFQKLCRVCNRFLSIDIKCLGYIPADNYLVKAVKAQKPVSILYPNSPAVKNIVEISGVLLKTKESFDMQSGGIKGYLKKFVNIFNSGKK